MGPINTITGRPLAEEQAARDYQVRGMGNVTQGLLPGPGFIDRIDADLGNAMRTAQVNPAGAVDTVSQYTVPMVLPQGLKTKYNPNVLGINYQQVVNDLSKSYPKIASNPKLLEKAKQDIWDSLPESQKKGKKLNGPRLDRDLTDMREQGYKEILHAYGQVPSEILDPIGAVKLFEDYSSSTGQHMLLRKGNQITNNPWHGIRAGAGVFHELNHDVLKSWGDSSQPLLNWHKLTKPEQERVMRSRVLVAVSQEMKAVAEAKGVPYGKSKFYTNNPIEKEARAFERWYLKSVRNKKKPSIDEFYDRFDKHQKILMQNLRRQAPQTWENLVLPTINRFSSKLGLGATDPRKLTMGTIEKAEKYATAPDSLMGISKNPMKQKGYGEHPGYKKQIEVVVDNPRTGDMWFDGMEGLNRPHAAERARRNWEGNNVRPVNSIKRFQNTQEAVAFGEKSSPRQRQLLGALRERAQMEAETAKKSMDYQKWMDLATDAQYYREALEAAEGKHPLQRKKK
jgi:hypothetical protein